MIAPESTSSMKETIPMAVGPFSAIMVRSVGSVSSSVDCGSVDDSSTDGSSVDRASSEGDWVVSSVEGSVVMSEDD